MTGDCCSFEQSNFFFSLVPWKEIETRDLLQNPPDILYVPDGLLLRGFIVSGQKKLNAGKLQFKSDGGDVVLPLLNAEQAHQAQEVRMEAVCEFASAGT